MEEEDETPKTVENKEVALKTVAFAYRDALRSLRKPLSHIQASQWHHRANLYRMHINGTMKLNEFLGKAIEASLQKEIPDGGGFVDRESFVFTQKAIIRRAKNDIRDGKLEVCDLMSLFPVNDMELVRLWCTSEYDDLAVARSAPDGTDSRSDNPPSLLLPLPPLPAASDGTDFRPDNLNIEVFRNVVVKKDEAIRWLERYKIPIPEFLREISQQATVPESATTVPDAMSSSAVAPANRQAPAENGDDLVKRSVLVRELEKNWPSIENDLKHADRNYLNVASAGRRGWWHRDKVLAWGRKNGKLRTPSG